MVTGFNDGIRPTISQTVIKEGGTGPNAGKVFYTPPHGMGILEAKMDNLVEFLNNDEAYPIDPLLKMAIGHYQFEAIYPFRDGNGRTRRIFNINYLTSKGLLDNPILFLSKYVIEHKEDYYAGLAGISQRGSWKAWLLYILKAVESISNVTCDRLMTFNIKEVFLNAIFTQPFTKVKHLVDGKVYAENTSRKYLDQLVDLKVLEKRTISGSNYYLNLELYKILSFNSFCKYSLAVAP